MIGNTHLRATPTFTTPLSAAPAAELAWHNGTHYRAQADHPSGEYRYPTFCGPRLSEWLPCLCGQQPSLEGTPAPTDASTTSIEYTTAAVCSDCPFPTSKYSVPGDPATE